MDQEQISNPAIKQHSFLEGMYHDSYFPKFLVNKVKNVLTELCFQIENEKPQNLTELYSLAQAAVDRINELNEEFFENSSELETAARDVIGTDFAFIAKAYGFGADPEELIANRDW